MRQERNREETKKKEKDGKKRGQIKLRPSNAICYMTTSLLLGR